MTLLEAVESLALIEANVVSCIHVVRLHSRYVAFFTIAILLPLVNTDLSDEFRAGEPRLWRDQARLLESEVPIEYQNPGTPSSSRPGKSIQGPSQTNYNTRT